MNILYIVYRQIKTNDYFFFSFSLSQGNSFSKSQLSAMNHSYQDLSSEQILTFHSHERLLRKEDYTSCGYETSCTSMLQ